MFLDPRLLKATPRRHRHAIAGKEYGDDELEGVQDRPPHRVSGVVDKVRHCYSSTAGAPTPRCYDRPRQLVLAIIRCTSSALNQHLG